MTLDRDVGARTPPPGGAGAVTTPPMAAGPRRRPGRPSGRPFTGTGPLVRLALRRDRILIPVWVVLFTAVAAVSASATVGLYPDVASRVAAAGAVNRATSLRALYGPIWDETSLGELSLFKVNALGAALVAVLSLVLLTRHTRGEEEAGRLELLGAGVLGRFAPLTAALIVSVGTNLLLAVLAFAGLVAAGLPAAGSLAFGLSWAATGTAFAAVAAVTAQVSTGARTAKGLAAVVLGSAYLLRAIGDASGPGWLSWLSPVGWAQQVRAFADNRWWVLLVPVGFAVAGVAAAFALLARRDLGAGVLADRPGPARAGRRLTGPGALALRLQRGTLLAWTAAYAVLGLVLGNLASSVGDFVDSPQARELIQRLGGQKGLVDAFFAAELGMVAVITSVFAIQSVLRLRSEEAGRRAEPLLATAVGRRRWLGSHLLVAVLGSAWLLIVVGAIGGAGYAVAIGDPGQVGRLLGASLSQLPAVLVMAGLAVAAFGLAPRLAGLAWAALVLFLLIGELGPLFELDRRVLDVSPFAHLPQLPGSPFTLAPIVWLTAVAAALLAVGVEGFRRRDLD